MPLSWWADRGCAYAGVDPLYHATVWMHERLGFFVVALAACSILTVVAKIVLARRRLVRLFGLSEALPARLARTFELAAAERGVAVPRIAYLDVGERIATTVFGPVVLLSRGFIDQVDDEALMLVARHELVHASLDDARSGVLWHLAFAALLVPGFEPLERRLHAARERRANLQAACGNEEAYLSVLTRMAQGAALCKGVDIGLEAPVWRPADRWFAWIAPVTIVLLAIALPLSHAQFMHDRPFLLTHHC